MKNLNIDALICPVNPGVAYRSGEPLKLVPTISYTTMFNMLDFPVGVLPVRMVTQKDIQDMEGYPVTDIWTKLFKDSMTVSFLKFSCCNGIN